MSHPFQDKIIVFIGKPTCCTRQEARDALFAVGGIIDENISTFVTYAVAFSGAEKTKKYKKAQDYKSFVTIISEEEFFDVLEGKADPPVQPKSDKGIIVIPPLDQESEDREQTLFMEDIINRKRLDNLAKHGIPTSDGGRMKIDFRSLDNSLRLIEFLIFENGKSLTATEIGTTKRKADVHGELDADLNEMLETLKRRIKKTLSTTYMEPSGYFAKSKAVGYVEYNHERNAHDIIIDGKPYTWSQLEKNISAHEGWKIKIEFGDIGDEFD